MTLELANQRLDWPNRSTIMDPQGPGPKACAQLVERKLQPAIERLGVDAQIGILVANPMSRRTEEPIAIVCDCRQKLRPDDMAKILRLAWSFARSPMF